MEGHARLRCQMSCSALDGGYLCIGGGSEEAVNAMMKFRGGGYCKCGACLTRANAGGPSQQGSKQSEQHTQPRVLERPPTVKQD